MSGEAVVFPRGTAAVSHTEKGGVGAKGGEQCQKGEVGCVGVYAGGALPFPACSTGL